ncbi:hypothetical protein [Neopusillimonas aromaticivorans]|uniref:hypothetical protein n=1 Tax=Neopusillimonas aromaticivorans TaxID=2979868 RepID=UPI00259315E9|nr:hypothetical protein [Neopusillimonas aromaticivorans]WJJ93985.1 hypothetical protein N7E01_02055 [Neopusillimonas aromaticivorans]
MNTPRLIKIGDALSQLANVTLLPRHRETTANESISGRAHRCGWRVERFIDWLFSPWERDHCRRAHEKDIERAREWVKMHRKR